LFGATVNGGTKNRGTLWELPAGASTVISLASFTGANGGYPFAGVVMDGAGNLFGTTYGNPSNTAAKSVVFELPAGSHTINVIAEIKNGSRSLGTLALDNL